MMPFSVLAEDNQDRCYLSDISYSDNPNLTREERIEAMNQAFFDSINQFEECMLTNSMNATADGAAGSQGGAAGGSPGSSGNGTQTLTGSEGSEGGMPAASNSAEAGELSGTETEPVDAGLVAEILEKNKPQTGEFEAGSETEAAASESIARGGPAGTGRAPADIPEANNDDVIAAQIRLAAEIETDPEKKARLWNEYRKYKGLPLENDE